MCRVASCAEYHLVQSITLGRSSSCTEYQLAWPGRSCQVCCSEITGLILIPPARLGGWILHCEIANYTARSKDSCRDHDNRYVLYTLTLRKWWSNFASITTGMEDFFSHVCIVSWCVRVKATCLMESNVYYSDFHGELCNRVLINM